MISIRGSASPTRCLYRSRSPPGAAAECAVTAQSGAIPWGVTAHSAEEAGPAFVKDRRRTVVAIGFEGLVGRADQLTRPPRSPGGDPHKRPMVPGKEFLPINVAVPLVTVSPVLIPS